MSRIREGLYDPAVQWPDHRPRTRDAEPCDYPVTPNGAAPGP